jgi:dTDP-4-dehydrorhamnose reductase
MGGRLLVFGGGGFVGGHLSALALRKGWEVHIGEAMVRDALPGARWHAVDITAPGAAADLVARVRPSAVIDLAAVADIDRAERERDMARAVNTDAARAIAAACTSAGSRCLYVSSDAVFAGTAERYAEDDPPAPVNWYGRTKADGERAVREACPGAVVVRLSLVLGFPVTDGNSFLAGLEQKLAARTPVPSPAEEIRTPVDAGTAVSCMLELVGGDFSGPFHLGSTSSVDRLTLTRRAAGMMGFSEQLVPAQPPGKPQPGRAARHARGVIGVERARTLLATPLWDWEKTLQKAFDERPGR